MEMALLSMLFFLLAVAYWDLRDAVDGIAKGVEELKELLLEDDGDDGDEEDAPVLELVREQESA